MARNKIKILKIILNEHIEFKLIINNFIVRKCQQQQTKTNLKWRTFFCKLLRIIKLFSLIVQRKATLKKKNVAPTNRNSLAFLLYSSKTFSNVELYSIFSQTFLELIFSTKIKAMLLKQSAILFTNCQTNIAYIMCLNT